MIKGTVERVFSKGKGWNIIVNNEFYGFGFDKPPFKAGTTIEFEFVENGRFKNVDKDTVKVLADAPPASDKKSGSTRNFNDGSWDRKDKQTRIHAARGAAHEFVKLAIEAQAVTLPAKKQDKLEWLELLVEDFTHTIYLRNTEYLDSDPSNWGDVCDTNANNNNKNEEELNDDFDQ